MTRSILIVCPPDSPLLAAGPAGARPPHVCRFEYRYVQDPATEWAGQPWSPTLYRPGATVRKAEHALPLLWFGTPCPEGMDRARRVMAASEETDRARRIMAALAACPVELDHDARHAWALATVCADRGLGRVLMLEPGADG